VVPSEYQNFKNQKIITATVIALKVKPSGQGSPQITSPQPGNALSLGLYPTHKFFPKNIKSPFEWATVMGNSGCCFF